MKIIWEHVVLHQDLQMEETDAGNARPPQMVAQLQMQNQVGLHQADEGFLGTVNTVGILGRLNQPSTCNLTKMDF